MAIPYRKETVKPDGRKLIAGGPRDQQRRVQEEKGHEAIINALRLELENIKVAVPVGTGEYTGEQMDDAVRQAVTEAHDNEKKNSAEQIDKVNKVLEEKTNKINELVGEGNVLKERIVSLTTTVEERDKSLERERERSQALLQQLTLTGDDLVIEADRPRMEPTFIDPLEKTAGERLTPHIEVDDIKDKDKEVLQLKVNKLKGLMGQLPKRD